ncbi:MAG: M15 family metallopeptidase [Eubacteriales bacterium]|nr:M15 family metallopeptidase [Eubacteriales bacterium]
MRDITLCHPKLQLLAGRLMEECRRNGLAAAVGETLRTVAEQDALYAQGRTRPGRIVTNAPGKSYSSYHQWGTAFDIYRNDGRGAYNEAGGFFDRVGKIGMDLGLEWGGTWKSIVDKPHFQLPDWGSSTSGIKKLYADPEEFKKTWYPETVKTGWVQEDGGWRFYLRDGSGRYVSNDWLKDGDNWYWFDGAGHMVHDTWYSYKGFWFYLGGSGAMMKGLQDIGGKWYYLDENGVMATEPVTLTPDDDGALKMPGMAA